MGLFKDRGKHSKDAAASTAGAQPAPVPAAAPVEAPVDPLAGFDIDAKGFPLNAAPADPDSFVAAFDVPPKKKHPGLKAFGITFGVLVAVLLLVYVAGAVIFMSRFLPNTSMDGQDLSLKTDVEVVKMLDDKVGSYKLDVVGGTFSYRTEAAKFGLEVDSEGIVAAMHEDLDAWRWPLLLAEQDHDESAFMAVRFDGDALEADLTEQLDAFNKSAKDPVNATIAYDEKTRSYQVKPEEAGTKYDVKSVVQAVMDTVPTLKRKLALDDAQLVQPTLLSTDEKLVESAEIATGLVSADVVLMMDGKQVGEVNGESLSSFVAIDDKLNVKFNDDAMNDWVNELTLSYDTVGTERNYTRPDGKQVTVKGGSYGWEIDSAALKDALVEAIKAGKKTELDVPCLSTAAVYAAPGQPDWGNRYLDVDISEQHVRFYGDDGSVIWEADCITGSPDGEHDTVKGVWYVNNKESPSKLIGYEKGKKIYETTVKWWMPFEQNSIGFHDAPWQPDFGGNRYAEGYGSHGCVNLSSAKAKELYGIVQIGDVVIVHA